MAGLIFRLLLKAMVPLGIVFGVMFYLMYLNGQDPMSMLDKIGGNALSHLVNTGEKIGKLPETVNDSISGEERTFYKWRDASGAWNYGENPPANAQSVTAIRMKLTDNVVPAFSPPAPDDTEQPESTTTDTQPLVSPYSPEQVKKLFDDAKNLQETLNQRQLSQDAMLGIKTE